MPEPIGRAEDLLPGHAMACSLQGIPYRDQGLYPNLTRSSEPASHFPFGQDPQVHKEAPLLISSFQRVAQLLTQCKRSVHAVATFREYQPNGSSASAPDCGKRPFLWEKHRTESSQFGCPVHFSAPHHGDRSAIPVRERNPVSCKNGRWPFHLAKGHDPRWSVVRNSKEG